MGYCDTAKVSVGVTLTLKNLVGQMTKENCVTILNLLEEYPHLKCTTTTTTTEKKRRIEETQSVDLDLFYAVNPDEGDFAAQKKELVAALSKEDCYEYNVAFPAITVFESDHWGRNCVDKAVVSTAFSAEWMEQMKAKAAEEFQWLSDFEVVLMLSHTAG